MVFAAVVDASKSHVQRFAPTGYRLHVVGMIGELLRLYDVDTLINERYAAVLAHERKGVTLCVRAVSYSGKRAGQLLLLRTAIEMHPAHLLRRSETPTCLQARGYYFPPTQGTK